MEITETIPHAVVELARQLGIGQQIFEVAEFTRSTFPGPFAAEAEFDPEWPDDRWICFYVEAEGSFDEILEREAEWGRQIESLVAPHLDAVTLFVTPR